MARLETKYVRSVAVSKDDDWIAAWGDVTVWDANTYKQKWWWGTERSHGVDFSPNATRLVVASDDPTATILDLATGNEVLELVHEESVLAAKYSPEGDRIATATSHHVRVWDSEDGRMLHQIQVSSDYIFGLVWGYNLLIVTPRDKVWKIKGTTVSEWSIPETNCNSRFAVQGRGEFVVSTTNRTVRFWDISTHTERPPIQHSRDIASVTLSPDDQFIAIDEPEGKITIKRLSHISVSIAPSSISSFPFRVAFYLFH